MNITSQEPSVHCVSQMWTISFLNVAEYEDDLRRIKA